ncbi:MAG: TrpB-like pyridoxal phosphate-dependent enzyme [archaeon]
MKKGNEQLEVRLGRRNIPKKYHNFCGSIRTPPPKHPGTGEPLGPEALLPLFTKAAVALEFSRKRKIEIPREVRDALYSINRPTPMRRALGLEEALRTKCRIYFKREDMTATGSHKVNTAIPQAIYARDEGVKTLVTETGAGQWGSALSLACARAGIGCEVFMVRCSYDQKPGRKTIMGLYGAEISPSPSGKTEFGRQMLSENPAHPGSLGIAISEAIETVAKSGGSAKYALGSVLNHVMIHQSVIGLEAEKQLRMFGEAPDHVVGCIGGGSNFAGIAFPLMRKFPEADFVAVEPEECASVGKGKYEYDFGDSAKTTPLLKMHTLGSGFIPPQIYAGGLRYHGLAPSLSKAISEGFARAVSIGEAETFRAAELFTRAEGIIPAPESAHAIAQVIRLARENRGRERAILFNLSGHGLLDLSAYDKTRRTKADNIKKRG